MPLLGDLDGVESGAFAELVADGPEFDGVGLGGVEAEAAAEDGVFAGGVGGGGEAVGGTVFEELEARGLVPGGEDLGERGRSVEFDVGGEGVGSKDGDANAGGAELERGGFENFAGFVEHLALFFDIAGRVEGRVVGIEVEGVGAGWGAGEMGAGLGEKLVEECGATAAGGLVGGGDDPFGAVEAVEGKEGEKENGCGAVG